MNGIAPKLLPEFSQDEVRALQIFRKYPEHFQNDTKFALFDQLEIEISNNEVDEMDKMLDESKYMEILEGYKHKLFALMKHPNELLRNRSKWVKKKAEIELYKTIAVDIERKVRAGEYHEYSDLSRLESKGMHIFRQYRDDLKPAEIPSIIVRLDKEMALEKLKKWEREIGNECGFSSADRFQLLLLKKHPDSAVRERAQALNKSVKKSEMNFILKIIEEKISLGEVDNFSQLNMKEEKALQTLREFRSEIDIGRISQNVLRLEEEMSSFQMVEWEGWLRDNRLSESVEGFHRAVIRDLCGHPNSGIACRAKVLNDVLNASRQGRRGRGGGRGGRSRGRSGRR